MNAHDKCPCCNAAKIGHQDQIGNRGCLVAFSCGSTCFFDENGVSIYHCGIPTRSERCWIREREDLHLRMRELEAKLAESVPREVAKDCAFLGLCCGSISTTNPYWAPEVVRVAACAENPQNDPGWADAILKDALARAEAKARE